MLVGSNEEGTRERRRHLLHSSSLTRNAAAPNRRVRLITALSFPFRHRITLRHCRVSGGMPRMHRACVMWDSSMLRNHFLWQNRTQIQIINTLLLSESDGITILKHEAPQKYVKANTRTQAAAQQLMWGVSHGACGGWIGGGVWLCLIIKTCSGLSVVPLQILCW
jgi:hypothetical protein